MKKSSKSLFRKVLLILFFATLLDGVVFVSSLYFSGSFDQIKENSISLFEQRINYRAENLRKTLVNDLYDEKNYEQLFQHSESYYTAHQSKKTDDLVFDDVILEDMITFLHYRSITGTYLILDREVFQTDYYPTIYLRDSAPNASYTDNSDISGKYGNAELLKQHNLSLESTWMPSIRLDENDPTYEFYFKTLQTAKDHPDLSSMELGYWGEPISLNHDLIDVFTYSIPLIAQDGTVYGVLGVDISTDYFKTLLPYKEINNEERNTYVLTTKEDHTYQSILSSGPAYEYVFKHHTPIRLEDKEKDETYRMEINTLDDRVLGHAIELNLYGRNSPFQEEGWYLIGISNESELLRSSHALARNARISIVIALIVGIGAAILISYKFTNPIYALVQQLKKSKPKQSVHLPRVNIDEIDELSTSIEIFSQGLIGAESRLSQIIYSLDIPIAAMEIVENGDVYCTEKLVELLAFEQRYQTITNFEKQVFDEQFEIFKQHASLYEEHEEVIDGKRIQVYVCYIDAGVNDRKWLRFTRTIQAKSQIIIVMDVTKEFEEKERLTYERNHDSLTGLLNRRAFSEEVNDLLTQKNLGTCGMVLWDLDNLKFVNDTYGHDGGDLLIKAIASQLKQVDTKYCIPARMAGDEFLVFYHHFKNEDALLSSIQNLHKKMMSTQIKFTNHDTGNIKVSVGIAYYPKDASTYDDLLHFADFAMYDAKNFQKGSVRCFNEEMYQHNKMLMSGRMELNTILDANLVRYAFQPIISAKDGSILGFEALMRPQSDILTSPQDVMLLARAQSQLYRVEYMTWTQSIKQYLALQHPFSEAKLFINSIPSIPMLDDLIKELESNYAKQLPHLVVELIETDEIEHKYLQVKQDFMARWNGKMAIDDFGSGYNSDTTLLNINADYIKIDIELIHNIDHDDDRQLMVKNIIGFAHQKHTYVIAEGVETKEEMETLISFHVDYLQGYYTGKPDFIIKDIDSKIKQEIQEIYHTYHEN